MTNQQVNNALDALMEHVDTLTDYATPGLGYHENRRALLWALIERANRELCQSEHDRNQGFEDAAEAKSERHREERHLQAA